MEQLKSIGSISNAEHVVQQALDGALFDLIRYYQEEIVRYQRIVSSVRGELEDYKRIHGTDEIRQRLLAYAERADRIIELERENRTMLREMVQLREELNQTKRDNQAFKQANDMLIDQLSMILYNRQNQGQTAHGVPMVSNGTDTVEI